MSKLKNLKIILIFSLITIASIAGFFVVNNNKQNNALQTEVVDLNTGLTYSGGWYLISSKSDLNTVRDNMANGKGLGYNYKLTADIDASSSEWVPFGYNTSSGEYNIFTGKFNGDGHKITIKLPQEIEVGKENVGDYCKDLGIFSDVSSSGKGYNQTHPFGLFGQVGNCTIQALSLNITQVSENTSIVDVSESRDKQYWVNAFAFGGIAGLANGATIDSCEIIMWSPRFSLPDNWAGIGIFGGIVGISENRTTVSNCYVSTGELCFYRGLAEMLIRGSFIIGRALSGGSIVENCLASGDLKLNKFVVDDQLVTFGALSCPKSSKHDRSYNSISIVNSYHSVKNYRFYDGDRLLDYKIREDVFKDEYQVDSLTHLSGDKDYVDWRVNYDTTDILDTGWKYWNCLDDVWKEAWVGRYGQYYPADKFKSGSQNAWCKLPLTDEAGNKVDGNGDVPRLRVFLPIYKVVVRNYIGGATSYKPDYAKEICKLDILAGYSVWQDIRDVELSVCAEHSTYGRYGYKFKGFSRDSKGVEFSEKFFDEVITELELKACVVRDECYVFYVIWEPIDAEIVFKVKDKNRQWVTCGDIIDFKGNYKLTASVLRQYTEKAQQLLFDQGLTGKIDYWSYTSEDMRGTKQTNGLRYDVEGDGIEYAIDSVWTSGLMEYELMYKSSASSGDTTGDNKIVIKCYQENASLKITTYNYNTSGAGKKNNTIKISSPSVDRIEYNNNTYLPFTITGTNTSNYELVGWSLEKDSYNRGVYMSGSASGDAVYYNNVPYYNLKCIVTSAKLQSRITSLYLKQSIGEITLYPIVVKKDSSSTLRKPVEYLNPTEISGGGYISVGFSSNLTISGDLKSYIPGNNDRLPEVIINGVKYTSFLVYATDKYDVACSDNGLVQGNPYSATDYRYNKVSNWASKRLNSGSAIPSASAKTLYILPLPASESGGCIVNYYAPILTKNSVGDYAIGRKLIKTETTYTNDAYELYDYYSGYTSGYYGWTTVANWNETGELTTKNSNQIYTDYNIEYTITYSFYLYIKEWKDYNITFYDENNQKMSGEDKTFNIKNLINSNSSSSLRLHGKLYVSWGGSAPTFEVMKAGGSTVLVSYEASIRNLDGRTAYTSSSTNLSAISDAFVGVDDLKDLKVNVVGSRKTFNLQFYYKYNGTRTTVAVNYYSTTYTENSVYGLDSEQGVKSALTYILGDRAKTSLYSFDGWELGTNIYQDGKTIYNGTKITSLSGVPQYGNVDTIVIYLCLNPINVTITAYGYKNYSNSTLQKEYNKKTLNSINNSSPFDVSSIYMWSYYYLGSITDSSYCDSNTPNAKFLGWKTDDNGYFDKFSNGLIKCNGSYYSSYGADWVDDVTFCNGLEIKIYGAWGYLFTLYNADGNTMLTELSNIYSELVDVNKAVKSGSSTYYICGDVVPVKASIWECTFASISSTSSSFYSAFATGSRYNGTAGGLKVSGDSSNKYYIGNVSLKMVSTITYNFNGGKSEAFGSATSATQDLPYGGKVDMGNAPTVTMNGYKFVGWTFDSENYTVATTNITINGQEYSGKQYSKGNAKYIINYKDDGYINYVVNIGLGSNIEVKACWEKEIVQYYTITYENKNGEPVQYRSKLGGTSALASKQVYADSYVSLYGNDIKTDLGRNKFLGWQVYKLDEGSIGWDKDRVYSVDTQISTKEFAGDVTLRPLFANQLTLNLNADDCEIKNYATGELDQILFDKNTNTILWHSSYKDFALPTAKEITRDGMVFLGWAVNKVGSETETTEYSNTDTYIKWVTAKGKDGKYYVTTIQNRGYEDNTNANYSYGDFELKAVWAYSYYTVTLDANDGKFTLYDDAWEPCKYSGGFSNIIQLRKDYSAFSQLGELPIPEKDGYVFIGWNTLKNGTGDAMTSKSYVNDDIVLYAQWKNTYTITLNSNGGELKDYSLSSSSNGYPVYSDGIITYTEDCNAFNLPGLDKIKKNGYTFDCWEVTKKDALHSAIWNNSELNGESTIPMGSYGNVTLTAQWKPIQYTITLNLNGGTLSYSLGSSGDLPYYNRINNTITYTIENSFKLPTAEQITKQGYAFAGWVVKSSVGSWKQDDTVTSVSGQYGNVTLEAQWGLTGYDITIDTNKGTLDYSLGKVGSLPYYDASKQTITYTSESEKFNLPNESQITREGYTFKGWKVSKNGSCSSIWNTSVLDAGTTIPMGSYGDVTLTAQWEIIEYKITLSLGSNDSLTENSTLTSNASTKTYPYISGNEIYYTIESLFTLPSAKRTGYSFRYWIVTETDNGDKWSKNSVYYGGASIKSKSGNATLSPSWTLENYTITFDFVTSDFTLDNYKALTLSGSGNIRTAKYTKNSNAELPIPSRVGYTFDGWKVTNIGTGVTGWKLRETYTFTADNTGNVTLTAQWTVVPYTITYIMESEIGATLLNGTKTSYDITETFNLASAEATGYKFDGWEVTRADGNWTEGTSYDGGQEVSKMYGNVELTAQWTLYPYTIKLELNGGKLEGYDLSTKSPYPYISGNVIYYTVESSFNLPSSSAITRNGYELAYWEVTKADGNWVAGSHYSGGSNSSGSSKEIVGIYGNVTLTARWLVIEYTITLNLNNGTLSGYTLSAPTSYPYIDGYNVIHYTIECNQFNLPDINFMKRNYYTFDTWEVTKTDDGSWTEGVLLAKDANTNAIYVASGNYGNVTLTAQWIENEYEITLDLNGGDLQGYDLPTQSPCPYIDGNTIYYTNRSWFNLPSSSTITRNGYTFAGWEVTKAGGNWYKGDIYLGGTNEIDAEKIINNKYGNVTIEAQWTIINYTISYATLSDSMGVNDTNIVNNIVQTDSYNVETDVQLLATASGYTISSWNLYGYYTYNNENNTLKQSTAGNWTSQVSVNVGMGKYGNVVLYIQGNKQSFAITLDANSGKIDGYPTASQIREPILYTNGSFIYYLNNEAFELPTSSQISRTGYTFAGWVVKAGDGENQVEYYETNSYTYNGVNFDMVDKNGKYYISGIQASSQGSVTLLAQWVADEYQITLNLNGGTLGDYIPTKDESATYPYRDGNIIYYTIESNFELPTAEQISREGYNFVSWNVGASVGNWKQDSTVTSVSNQYGNVSLTAQWKIVVYNINYVVESIEGRTIGAKLPEGTKTSYNITETFNLASNITANSYTFKCWRVSVSVGNWKAVDGTYAGGRQVSKMKGGFDENGDEILVTLEAQWTPIEYTITLDLNGGKLSGYGLSAKPLYPYLESNVIHYTVESVFELPTAEQMTKSQYGFAGWTIVSQTDGNWTVGSEIQSVNGEKYGNITGQAQWGATRYKVTLNANEGNLNYSLGSKDSLPYYNSNDDGNQAITYTSESSAFNLPTSAQITREGYTFTGWKVSRSGSCSSNWNVSTLGAGYKIETGSYGNVTLTAQWEIITYTIRYAILNDTDAINAVTIENRILSAYNQTYTIEDIVTVISSVTGYESITQWQRFGYYDGTQLTDGSSYGNWDAIVSLGEYSSKYGNVVLYKKGDVVSYTITLQTVSGIIDASKYNPSATFDAGSNKIFYTSTTETFNLPTSSQITRDGYSFKGWKVTVKGTDCSGNWNAETISTVSKGSYGNVTLEAVWEVIPYTITLSSNKGSIKSSYTVGTKPEYPYFENNSIHYTVESSFNLPSKDDFTTVNGWKFIGWTITLIDGNWARSGNTVDFAGGEKLTDKYGNVTLTAQWELVTYTIKLSRAGGIIDDAYALEKEPTLPYYKNSSIKYNILSSITLPYGNYITKTGYDFAGWKVKENVGNWVKDTIYTTETLTEMYGYIGEDEVEYVVELEVQWTPTPYTITLNLKDGESLSYTLSNEPYPYIEGNIIHYTIECNQFNLPDVNNMTRKHYVFNTWKVVDADENCSWTKDTLLAKDSNTSAIYVKSKTYGNVTLEAVWDEQEYTIKYKAGQDENLQEYPIKYPKLSQSDEDVLFEDTEVKYTISTSVALLTVVRDGYTFTGWEVTKKDDDCGAIWNTSPLQAGTTIPVGSYGNVTLTAKWEQDYYLIYYAILGDDDDISASVIADKIDQKYTDTYNIKSKVNLLKNITGYSIEEWTLYGYYTLEGSEGNWNLVQSGKGNWNATINTSETLTKMFGNVVLYKQGSQTSYSVKLNENYGKIDGYPNDEQIKSPTSYFADNTMIRYFLNNEAFALPTSSQISRIGYTFAGWVIGDVEGYDSSTFRYTDAKNGIDINFTMTENDGKYYISGIKASSKGSVVLNAKWIVNKYTINLNVNGGEIVTGDNGYKLSDYPNLPYYVDGVITYTIENVVDLPTKFTISRQGYKFLGWTFGDDDNGYSSNAQLSDDCVFQFVQVGDQYYIYKVDKGTYASFTLKAKWQIITYHIEYEISVINGANLLTGVTQSYTIEDTFDLANNVTANAYNFKNWKVLNSVGNWIAGTTYNAGETLSRMVGYIDDDGIEITVKLQAQWEAIKFTIQFSSGDYEDVVLNANIKPITYTSDDTFTFPNSDIYKAGATRTGYTFAGWKVQSTVGNWEENSVVWQVGNDKTVLSAKYGDVTFVPIWNTPDNYTLTILLKTSEIVTEPYLNGEQKDQFEMVYDINSIIPIPTKEQVVAKGYEIVGFKVKSSAGNWILNSQLDLGANLEKMYGDTTIEAIWNITNYTLTLNLDNGNINNSYKFEGVNAIYNGDLKTITFNVTSSFSLPTSKDISKSGNRFLGWVLVENGEANLPYATDEDERFEFVKIGDKYYITGFKTGNAEDLEVKAYWLQDMSNITLDVNGGSLVNYFVKNENLADGEDDQYLTFDAETFTITYHSSAKFYLPDSSHLIRKGFTFRGWMATIDTNGKTDYNDIVDKYNTDSQRQSFGNINFILAQNSMDKNYYLTGVKAGSSGGIELIAIWEENEYTVVFNYNNAQGTSETRRLKYSECKILDIIPQYENYVFVGWNSSVYQTDRYQDIYSNITNEFTLTNPLNLTESNIVWGAQILVAGSYIQSLVEGKDCRDTNQELFTIYAVWLPVYTVTVEANGGQVVNDGITTSLTKFEVKNTFFNGYTLQTTQNNEIFKAPTTSGYRLFRKGYSIKNWTITVNGNQYIVGSEYSQNPPEIYMWIQQNGQVDCGINLQYLQGNIIATPNWEAMKFDVVFRTNGDESYKLDTKYQSFTTKDVVFNSKYFFYPDTNIVTGSGEYVIQSTSILGYSVIYANPYNDVVNGSETNKQIVDITISPSGIWNYEGLTYRQHIIGDGSGRGTGWYVEIEGYYAPISYRVKLNVNKPYDASMVINEGDFAKTSASAGNLQARYQKLSLNSNREYEEVAEYLNYQGRLFEADGEYYIYLLHDQEIKSVANENGVELPTFEIDYYEMQYYKLNDTLTDRYYVITDNLKVEQPSTASQPKDWKYSYCNINGVAGGNGFEFNVVWYRNVINLEINNIIQNQNSANGYVVVSEEEQLTGSLKDHNTTNVIIFTYDKDSLQSRYITFSFDGKFEQPISTLLNYTVEELNNLSIKKITDNKLTIYSGNKVTFTVYDQSKDNSLDTFVGYRFNKFSNSMKEENVGSCTEIAELKDVSQYSVQVDFANYAESLEDKDCVIVNVEFSNIIYKLRYIIGDAENVNAVDKYGVIELTYSQMSEGEDGKLTFTQVQKDITDETLQYVVDAGGIRPIESLIKVKLGYQLDKWTFSNNIVGSFDLGTDILYSMLLTPQFLRQNLYTDTYSVEAEQDLGYIKAECKVIEFGINIHIVDVANGEELESYLLSDDVQPKVFTLRGESGEVTTVIINKNYTMKMITLADGKTQLYYSYNGKNYAYKGLYLASSLNYSTNQLITSFAYPTSSLPDIALNVDYDLLDKTVNYTQNTAVAEENRFLHFYVEVAPLAELTFEVETDKFDIHKELREIIVNGQVVLRGENGSALQVKSSYIGYLTQQIKIVFSGNSAYYSKAILTLPNGEVVEIATNGENGYAYEITNAGKIIVKLVPKTYLLDAQIEYNGKLYNATDFKDIVNASNVNLFDLNKGVEMEASTNNTWFYTGDTVLIKYLLNSTIQNDYMIQVLANNSGLLYNSSLDGYLAEFAGSDLHIVIKVSPKTNTLTIITNMQNEDIGEVYVEVNKTIRYIIQDSGSSDQWQNELTLEAGDTVRVYYKTNVGFKFDGKYTDSKNNEFEADAEMNTITRYYWFDMFGVNGASGTYDSSKISCYILYFTHLSIDVEFRYFVGGIENTFAGEGYSFSSSTPKINVGTEISIIKGKDNYGYRFINYTYDSPNANQDAVELSEKFTIDGEILKYLETLPIGETSITLVIYINYIDQYTVTFDLDDNTKLLLDYSFKNEEGTALEQGVLYDRGTELTFDIYAKDKLHYYLDSQITVGTITYEYSDDAETDLSRCSAVVTNNQNRLSGFSVNHTLRGNIKVKVKVYAEQFDVSLVEGFYESRSELDDNNPVKNLPIDLRSNGSKFTTKSTIHYMVTGSFYYGTKVKIEVWVENPDWDSQEYYRLDRVVVNGKEAVFKVEKDVAYDGKNCIKYTLEYELVGDELQNRTIIEVDYKVIKAVKVKFFV